MCCFSGKVDQVKNTRIFARLGEGGSQFLIYEMDVSARQDVAMVLPGLVKPDLHVRRRQIQGMFTNGDIVAKPRLS